MVLQYQQNECSVNEKNYKSWYETIELNYLVLKIKTHNNSNEIKKLSKNQNVIKYQTATISLCTKLQINLMTQLCLSQTNYEWHTP